ncbi:hypothetical protein [Agathobaculum hominis]
MGLSFTFSFDTETSDLAASMTKEVIALSFAKAPVSIASRRLDWPSLQPICTLVSFYS